MKLHDDLPPIGISHRKLICPAQVQESPLEGCAQKYKGVVSTLAHLENQSLRCQTLAR